MNANLTIEGRLEAVEHAVAEIKRELDSRSPSPDWLDQIIGSFKDEPAFDEVIRLGREIRKADRSVEDDES